MVERALDDALHALVHVPERLAGSFASRASSGAAARGVRSSPCDSHPSPRACALTIDLWMSARISAPALRASRLATTLTAWRPAGRFGWDFHGLLLVLLDTLDRLAQPAMHVRIARQVLAHGVSHAREFALDDALLGFTTRGQQHLAIARARGAPASESRSAKRRRSPRASAPAAAWIAWWAVFLARYRAATSRISRIAADTAGHGVNVNRFVMDMAVLAWGVRLEYEGARAPGGEGSGSRQGRDQICAPTSARSRVVGGR